MVNGLAGEGVNADFGYPDVHILDVAVQSQELASICWVLHYLSKGQRRTLEQSSAIPLRTSTSAATERDFLTTTSCFPSALALPRTHRSEMAEKTQNACIRLSFPYLSHVDDSHRQSLVAQNSPVLVSLSPLEHNLEFVAISLQEVWILQKERQSGKCNGLAFQMPSKSPSSMLHLDSPVSSLQSS